MPPLPESEKPTSDPELKSKSPPVSRAGRSSPTPKEEGSVEALEGLLTRA
jgi:hypothetical protein